MRVNETLISRFKCCFCEITVNGPGNNSAPLNENRCCNDCNLSLVIPARLKAMESSIPITRKCKCCKKDIQTHSVSQKYCGFCSVFTLSLRQRVSHFKSETIRLKKLLYGQKTGAERLR